MPILKVYDISTPDKVREIDMEASLKRSSNTQSEYTVDDIMLVRTTDYLPENRVIRPYSETPNAFKNGDNFLCSQLFEESPEVLKAFEIYYPYYRSTIHTTENGLVSSHMYGNFIDRNFIILEPLREQIDKSNIRNFAGQDTIIKGDMVLSDDSVIIINALKYPELLEKYEELNNYNICLYNGISPQTRQQFIDENPGSFCIELQEERAVTSRVLMDMGYTPETIGTHYITQSETSNKIYDLNSKLASERGVESNTKHQYTQEYIDDFQVREDITRKCDRILLDFIIKFNNLDISKEEFINNKGNISGNTAHIIKGLIGIDGIENSVNEFNNTIEQMKSKGIFPTPEEFVSNNDLDIYSNYELLNSQVNKL